MYPSFPGMERSQNWFCVYARNHKPVFMCININLCLCPVPKLILWAGTNVVRDLLFCGGRVGRGGGRVGRGVFPNAPLLSELSSYPHHHVLHTPIVAMRFLHWLLLLGLAHPLAEKKGEHWSIPAIGRTFLEPSLLKRDVIAIKRFHNALCSPWSYHHGKNYLHQEMIKRCRKPPRYVPYKCTYVPYNGTFGASDQGQMLDVWGWHPADVNTELLVTPDVTSSLWKIPWTSQDISVGISADPLDHLGWIQGWIQFNGHSVR